MKQLRWVWVLGIAAVLLTGEAFRAGERVPGLTARVREQVLADDTPPEPV